MTIRQLVLLGDSLTQGTTGIAAFGAGGFSLSEGGRGSWADIVTEKLASIQTLGPLLSSGYRGIWLGSQIGSPWVNGTLEWGVAPQPMSGGDGWNVVISTDAWDKTPYGTVAGATLSIASNDISFWNNGATKIMTWTKPPHWRNIVGFAIYWVDKNTGGNWSYRIDGGAWTNMGQTLANDNKLCKFYVGTAVNTAVDIRCANAAGTGVDCLISGIELFYSTATSGLIVHNLGVNGSELDQIVSGGGGATSAGDRLAFLDAVKLGTGSPITNVPDLGVVMGHINDVLLGNSNTWDTNVRALNTRIRSSDGGAAPLGPLSIWSPWECDPGTYNTIQQGFVRTQTKITAAALGLNTYDVYDDWALSGWTGNAAANTQGFLLSDLVHESQAGHIDLGNRLYTFIKSTLPAPFNTMHNTAANVGSRTRVSSGMSSSGTAW